MREETFERVRAIAADLFEVSPARIQLQTTADDIESWDSLQHLNLVLALEQEFDVQFEPDEMERMSSIEQIVATLEARR